MSQERNLSPAESSSSPPNLDTFRVDLKSYKQIDFDQSFDENDNGSEQSDRNIQQINTTFETMNTPNTPDSQVQIRFSTKASTKPISRPLVPQVIVTNLPEEQAPKLKSTQKSGHNRIYSTASDDLVDAYREEYIQSVETEDTVDSSEPFTNPKVNKPQCKLLNNFDYF